MFNGKIHYKWPFSIAMLNYQRVPHLRNGDEFDRRNLGMDAKIDFAGRKDIFWPLQELGEARNGPERPGTLAGKDRTGVIY